MPDIYTSLRRLTAQGGADERAASAAPWAALFPSLADNPGEPSSVWKALSGETNLNEFAPKPVEGVDSHPVFERGKTMWVLRRLSTSTYLRLSAEDYFLWTQMDGQRTVSKLTMVYLMKYKAMALGRILGLIELLGQSKLLENGQMDEVYGPLTSRLRSGGPRSWMNWAMQTFLMRQWTVRGMDGPISKAYAAGVWLFYTRPMLWLYILVSVLGLAATATANFSITDLPKSVPLFFGFLVAAILIFFLHECGHAFTVKHFKRTVTGGGFFIMYGAPGVFVDTTDMWLAPRKQRLAVTAGGPAVNLILGGLCALLALARPDLGLFLHVLVWLNYILVFANLVPFIKLDGYYLLMDWLEIPNLLERASAFLSKGLWLKTKQGWAQGEWIPTLTRDQKIFVLFGGISTLYTFYLIYFSTLLLPVRLLGLVARFQTANLQSLAGAFVIGSAVLTLVFGAAQLTLTTNRLNTLRKRLTQAIRTLPAWQSVAMLIGLCLVVELIPELLMVQSHNTEAAHWWAVGIPIGAAALAALLAGRLAWGMQGTPWRWWYGGLTVTAVGLVGAGVLEQTPWAGVSLGLPWRALLATVAAVSFLGAAHLWAYTFRGGIAGAWLLIWLGLLGVSLPEADAVRFGSLALASGLFLAWHLMHLPQPQIARPVDVAEGEALDPKGEAAQLSRAFAWLMSRTLTQAVSIFGGQSFTPLARKFNREAALKDWPIWFTASDHLTDATAGMVKERSRIYRSAVMVWLAQFSSWIDTQLAANTLTDTYLELPPRLRQLAAEHILSGYTTDGSAFWEVEKRGGDRLRFLIAFRYLAEGTLRACERLYGRPMAQQVMRDFNRTSARAEWGLWFWGDSRLNADARRSADLMALSNLLQLALAHLLQRLAYYTGDEFVRLSLVQAYDGLPWQMRELAAPTLLSRLPWARGLEKDQSQNVADFLHKLPHFTSLSEDALHELAEQARVEHWPANRRLYPAGHKLAWAYIVQAGRVEIVARTGRVKRLIRTLDYDALIGYDEILQDKASLDEARTLTPVTLIRLPADAARRALEDAPLDPEAALLSRIPVFRDLTFAQLRSLAERLKPRDLTVDEVVVRRGDLGRELYVIGWGELQVTIPDKNGREKIVAQMGPGEFFGELALLRDEPRTATVRALTDAQVWSLSAEDCAAFLKEVPALQATLEQIASRRQLELRTA